MKTDIEIAQSAKLEKIDEIASKPTFQKNPLSHMASKAKISLDYLNTLENQKMVI